MELEIHAELEQKLIYHAIRQEIDEDGMMNEAVEEHHLVHVLINELKKLKPADEIFQATFTVLGELVKHHIEQEDEMLPKAEKSDPDWESLETTVMKRKEAPVAKSSPGAAKKRPSKAAADTTTAASVPQTGWKRQCGSLNRRPINRSQHKMQCVLRGRDAYRLRSS